MTSNKGGSAKYTPKEGLFDDLQDLSESEISEKISAMKAGIDAGEKELQRIQQERESEIGLVQSLRAIQESARGKAKSRIKCSPNSEKFDNKRRKQRLIETKSTKMSHLL